MIVPKGISKWTFKTSQGRSGGIAQAALAKGDLFMTSPEGKPLTLHYSSIGLGASFGAPFNENWSTTDMFSDGVVFILEGCPGPELAKQDFLGKCMIVEVAAGASGAFGKGWAVDGLLMGIDSVLSDFVKLQVETQGGVIGALATMSKDDLEDDISSVFDPTPRAIADPRLRPKRDHTPIIDLNKSAKAFLVVRSENRGQQFTVGGSLSYGRVWADPVGNKPAPPLPVPVRRTPTETLVTLPGDVLFDFDQDTFRKTKETEEAMNHICEIVKANAPLLVEVHGHTDNIGNGNYNWDLSNRRAQKTGQSLIDRGCVSFQQLRTMGHGFWQPVATNRTSEGRAFNRRIEVKILKRP
jgi:outer membrane protein OmpA-like peptidoglycan-associated protein